MPTMVCDEQHTYNTPELVTYGTVEDLTGTFDLKDGCFGDELLGKGLGIPNDGGWRHSEHFGTCS